MEKKGQLEWDEFNRVRAVWTLQGERIAAEDIRFAAVGYDAGSMMYVLIVWAVNPQTGAVRPHGVQAGRVGTSLLKALRELSNGLIWLRDKEVAQRLDEYFRRELGAVWP